MKAIFLLAGLLVVLAQNCDKKNANVKTYPFDEKISLKYNEQVYIGSKKLAITFKDIQDSRCPKDVTCIRAGEAKVFLEVRQQGSTAETCITIKRNVHGGYPGMRGEKNAK